jgi:hypothetical protein
MNSRTFSSIAQARFLDCSLQYSGPAEDTVRGLWHLEGCRVSALVDGSAVEGLTVENGALTLPGGITGTVIDVGLPIVGRAQTLPLAQDTEAGGQGIDKNVNEVAVRVKATSGFKIGPTFNDLNEWTVRNQEAYDSPTALYSGVVDVDLFPTWGPDASICIEQRLPLPVTLSSFTFKIATGA